MSDLISRQAAIDAVLEIVSSMSVCLSREECRGMKRMQGNAVNVIKELPSAQPERKTGWWIDTGSGQECSKCHEIQYGYDSGRFYCPNCGAKMEAEVEE